MNRFSPEQQAILVLLRQALWNESNNLLDLLDWELLAVVAKQQGILTFAYDAAVAMNAELPDEIREKWHKLTIMSLMRNERLLSAQDKVLGWFEQAGIPAVVLKGSTVSRYYPQPDLRVLGDIDILIPEKNIKMASEIMIQNGYTFHEHDHDFHLGFSKPGIWVEIHYDVTHLPANEGTQTVFEQTKQFLDSCEEATISTHRFPALSESNQGLMLLLHMARHMIDGGIGLRQLCDWAMYIANTNIDRFALETVPVLAQCGLLRYAQVATAVCTKYLGLPQKFAGWCQHVTDADAFAFMEDVFSGGNMGDADSEKIGRVLARGSAIGSKRSFIHMLFASLTETVYYSFPVTRKHKWLLPIFWVYQPIRYWVRSLLGVRTKKSIRIAAQRARRKQRFYERLALFQPEMTISDP